MLEAQLSLQNERDLMSSENTSSQNPRSGLSSDSFSHGFLLHGSSDKISYSENQRTAYSAPPIILELTTEKVVVPAAELYIGQLLGVTFAKLMIAALRINNLTLSLLLTANMSMAAPPIVRPAMLPPKATAELFVHIYFSQSNSQLPIFHRVVFLREYFEPIYGPWTSHLNLGATGAVQPSVGEISIEDTWFYQYKQVLSNHFSETGPESETAQIISDNMFVPRQYHRSLFFLNMVFALASSANHLQYVSTISESFKSSAFKYLEEAETSPDPLEKLEITLLMALYSLMRPAVPGVWYVLGKALRMCVDLGLHSETVDKTKSISAFTKDRRRRLFWCTYALDRQVCFYLGRPVGIPEASIKTPFPLSLDDIDILESDTETEDYSLIVEDKRTSKTIAMMIFCIRQIQLEVQRTLYENEELPRRFPSLLEWNMYIYNKLELWWQSTPKLSLETVCGFNVEYFMLNYDHTLLMIDGLSPKSYSLSKDAYIRVSRATRSIMRCYTRLYVKKAINYTWAAVHNLFMAGTSFLFAIYHCDEVRASYSEHDFKKLIGSCVIILGLMKDSCDAAQGCSEMYRTLAAAVLKLRYENQGEVSSDQPMDSLPVPSTRSRMKVSSLVIGTMQEPPQRDSQTPDLARDWARPWAEQNNSPLELQSLELLYSSNMENFFEELVNISPEDLFSFVNDNEYSEQKVMGQTEGKRVLELIHQVPGEPIWDQFFSSTAGLSSYS